MKLATKNLNTMWTLDEQMDLQLDTALSAASKGMIVSNTPAMLSLLRNQRDLVKEIEKIPNMDAFEYDIHNIVWGGLERHEMGNIQQNKDQIDFQVQSLEHEVKQLEKLTRQMDDMVSRINYLEVLVARSDSTDQLAGQHIREELKSVIAPEAKALYDEIRKMLYLYKKELSLRQKRQNDIEVVLSFATKYIFRRLRPKSRHKQKEQEKFDAVLDVKSKRSKQNEEESG